MEGEAVGHHVMGTNEDCDDVRFDRLDGVDVPQRVGGVHRPAEQVGHERPETGDPSRRGQLHVRCVAGDVEVGVVHPDRCRCVGEHGRDPLAEARQRVEAGFDVRSQLGDAQASAFVAKRCRLEEAQRADLQLRATRLRAQQRDVFGAQRLGRHAPALDDGRESRRCLRFPHVAQELRDAVGQTLRAGGAARTASGP